jgi:hypothetical protein
MEKISWTDRVGNGGVLHRLKEERNSLHIINRLKTELNLICHLLALVGAHPIFHVSRIRVKRRMVNWFGVNCVGTAF